MDLNSCQPRNRCLTPTLAAALAAALAFWAPAARPATAGAPGTVGGPINPAAQPTFSAVLNDLNNRFSGLQAGISSANASQLHLAWMIPTQAPATHMPLVNNGRVFFADWGGFAYAADAGTGKILWQKQLEGPIT